MVLDLSNLPLPQPSVLFLVWTDYSLDQPRYHPGVFFNHTSAFVQVSRFNLGLLYFNEIFLPRSLTPFG